MKITAELCDLSNNILPFSVTTTDTYILSFTLNSNHKEDLHIQIQSGNECVYTYCAPVYCTGIMNDSGDAFFARQKVDTKTKIYLEKDKEYTLSYHINQPIHVYEIDIDIYNNDKYNVYNAVTFVPEHVDCPYATITEYNKYCIIPNISAYFGGLWWCVRIAVTGIALSIDHNLIPVLDHGGGLYASNSYYDPSNLPESWWNYYFEDPISLNPLQKDEIIQYSKTNRRVMNFGRRTMRNRTPQLQPIAEKTVNMYIRPTYNRFHTIYMGRNVKDTCKKFLRPLPYIKDYCNDFWKNTGDTIRVGVHYRGTDKYATGTTNEGHPIHYEYDNVLKMIYSKMDELNVTNYVVYGTSDEAPFIEFMKSKLKDKFITNEHDIRSDTCTSGQSLDLRTIRFSKSKNDDVQQIYDDNKGSSIHFGKKDTSNYLKGLYSVIDCLLLSQCQYIFCSRGNFSDFASYMSDESSTVFDMNDLHKKIDDNNTNNISK